MEQKTHKLRIAVLSSLAAAALLLVGSTRPAMADARFEARQPNPEASGEPVAIALKESFTLGSLPDFLRQSSTGAPAVFYNGAVIFPGRPRPQGRRDLAHSRSYLRTKISAFNSISFIADLTVTLPPGSAYGTAFLGMGTAEPTDDFWGEPRQGSHIYSRAAPTAFANGYFGVTRERVENPVSAARLGAGDGTHRLRLTWDAQKQTATFAIHKNYTGGPFIASSVLGPVDATDVGFDDTNSSVFFGGADSVAFDDLVLTIAVGADVPLEALKVAAEPPGGRTMHTQSTDDTEGGYGQPGRPVTVLVGCRNDWWIPIVVKELFRSFCAQAEHFETRMECNDGLEYDKSWGACGCPLGEVHFSGDRCSDPIL